MERILIIGSGGAGKSTLSRELSSILDLPVVHLDQLFWHPGWIETPGDEWMKVVESKIGRPRWIMDGNYSGTMEMRVAAADTIIFLNLSRWICLKRVLKRTFQYRGKARPDMTEGCPEKMGLEYFKFLQWIWTYPREKTPGILKTLEDLKETKRVLILQSPREVKMLLEVLKASTERRA